MFDRHPAREQRLKKLIPASPLIAHAVNENVSFFSRIAPLPIVHVLSRRERNNAVSVLNS